MLGEGFRVIASSRFGYFGSTLPPHATPADQAEVYVLLLDRLGSAGPPSSPTRPAAPRRWSSPCATPGGSWG
jgi:hypothetical protein